MFKERRAKYAKNYYKTIQGIFAIYKGNAKSKKRNWYVSLEQFQDILIQPCFYCGDFDLKKRI